MACPELQHRDLSGLMAPRRWPTTRTQLRQEIRRMRFEETHDAWPARRLRPDREQIGGGMLLHSRGRVPGH